MLCGLCVCCLCLCVFDLNVFVCFVCELLGGVVCVCFMCLFVFARYRLFSKKSVYGCCMWFVVFAVCAVRFECLSDVCVCPCL